MSFLGGRGGKISFLGGKINMFCMGGRLIHFLGGKSKRFSEVGGGLIHLKFLGGGGNIAAMGAQFPHPHPLNEITDLKTIQHLPCTCGSVH